MDHTPTTSPFTAEIDHSDNPVNKQGHHDIFVKLYTVALNSGFLAATSDRDWKTLCVLALHMDAEGRCYPSRDAIARALGVNPSTASDRIQHLVAFRWQGQPLVKVTRERQADGTLGRQVYTILPIVPLGFGPEKTPPDPTFSPAAPRESDGPSGDVPPTRSGFPDLVGGRDHDRQENLLPDDKTPDGDAQRVGRNEQGDSADPSIWAGQPVPPMSGFSTVGMPDVDKANVDASSVMASNMDGSNMAEASSVLSYAPALNKIQVKQDPG